MEDSVHVEDDSPNRCQGMTAQGQCRLEAMDNGFCTMHGGRNASGLKNYMITKYKNRLGELGNNANIKSLGDEVAILRILLEERFNKITDNTQLILHTGPISALVRDISNVITAMHKLDLQTGSTLDKSKLVEFAQEVVDIIGEVIVPGKTITEED